MDFFEFSDTKKISNIDLKDAMSIDEKNMQRYWTEFQTTGN